MKASSSSFAEVVENAAVVTFVVPDCSSAEIFASMLRGPADPVEDWAVKLIPLTFAPLITTDWLWGVNVYPFFDGVTVYVPLVRAAKEKCPAESAVVLAVVPPVIARAVPDPTELGVTVPEMLNVEVPGDPGRISRIERL